MENPQDPRPAAAAVNRSKRAIVSLGVLALIAGIILLFGGEPAAYSLIGAGLGSFILGGVIAGLAEITHAAELYVEEKAEAWEAAKHEQPPVDDAEVQ